jgi:hypothetical protein
MLKIRLIFDGQKKPLKIRDFLFLAAKKPSKIFFIIFGIFVTKIIKPYF